MPEQKTAYEISDVELTNKLIQTAAKAGTATSGLIIDIMGSVHVTNLHYYKGCILARLAGLKPEIQPGIVVSIPAGKTVMGSGLDGFSFGIPVLPTGDYAVERVWYFKDKWHLELRGHEGLEGQASLYPADQFTIPGAVPAGA
jgi:hypothetical protein